MNEKNITKSLSRNNNNEFVFNWNETKFCSGMQLKYLKAHVKKNYVQSLYSKLTMVYIAFEFWNVFFEAMSNSSQYYQFYLILLLHSIWSFSQKL